MSIPKLLAVFASLALLAAIWVHRAFQEDTTSAARTAIAASSPQNPEDLRLNAWIDDSHIRRNTTITFWIAIQNTTLEPIRGVSVLAFRRPNFSLAEEEARTCWAIPARPDATSADAVPVCVAEGKGRLPVSLPAGGVVTVEGHLRARDEPGQYSIAAVVGWTDAAGVQRRTPISVGPVTVEHEARKTLATITRASQNFLKDLGLPLVFLGLAYWVKQLEEARQASNKKAEERAERVRQTWTQMLPKVHENAEKYYMPLMAFARQASKMSGGQRASGIFSYLRFLGRMKEMADGIGGFYLKTRAGENIIGDTWDAIRIRADARFTPAIRQELQKAIVPITTVDLFEALPASSLIATQRETFAIETFGADAVLLQIYHLILTYETNLSYEFWYEEDEQFPAWELEAALRELEERGRETQDELFPKYRKFVQSLWDYIKARRVQKHIART